MKTIHSCPNCGTIANSRLAAPALITCLKCNAIVFAGNSANRPAEPSPVPPDWSFVQTGSDFQYGGKSLVITGRIRLQLRNDYKNFWCAASPSGAHVWLMESFASFAALSPKWLTFDGPVKKLHAGNDVAVDDLKLHGEYVEKCERLAFEGEIGEWIAFRPKFFFIQCSNNEGHTAVFVARESDISYLPGMKVAPETLQLKNIVTWDEWK